MATVLIYIVTDFYGNRRWAVAKEPSDTIIVSGMAKGGKFQQFESEPRHLHGWASEHGFAVECVEKTFEI